jgi:general secretion pathway protein G
VRTKKLNRPGRNHGFTLVEIMVVVVILGLLATLVAPRVYDQLFRSQKEKAKMDIYNIKQAVEQYRIDHMGRLPESLEELVTPDENGRVYIDDRRSTPRDPWDNEYVLEEDPERRGGIIIRSFGEDGERETEDDITNMNMHEREEDQ